MTDIPYEPIDLDELVETVHSEETFIQFVQAMAYDFALHSQIEKSKPSPPYSTGALGWENGTVDTVLDAAAACAEDATSAATNPWQRCAEILLGGKFYE